MWDGIENWHLVLPPSRPSSRELTRICRLASRLRKDTPVAVLGSTPEFRDLLNEAGFSKIFVFDRSKAFYLRMTRLCAFETLDETFVHGDWLETLPKFIGQFGLILSDLTSGNVPYEDRGNFYRLIEESLVSGGWFVDKVLTNERSLLTIRRIQARYRRAAVNLLTANYFSCEAIFCSELHIRYGCVDTSRIYRDLELQLVGNRYKNLLDMARLITPEKCLWYYGRPWSELSQEYCAGLLCVGSFDQPSNSPYFGRARQFFLRKP